MRVEIVEEILVEQFEARKEDGELILPESKRVALLLIAGETLMPVSRVRRVRFTDAYVCITTDEQRYFVDPAQLLGVRQDDYEARSVDSRPGFHRA